MADRALRAHRHGHSRVLFLSAHRRVAPISVCFLDSSYFHRVDDNFHWDIAVDDSKQPGCESMAGQKHADAALGSIHFSFTQWHLETV